jgi:protein TonB
MRRRKGSWENHTRLVFFIVAAALHAGLIYFVAFRSIAETPKAEEPIANVIRLVDVREELPPPPPPPPRDPSPVVQNTVEAVAETMIETDEVPEEVVAGPESVQGIQGVQEGVREGAIDYLPMSRISVLPKFDEERIRRATVYPPIALRANIEGIVYLELFVDNKGEIREIRILRETPGNRGFGEAAVSAFKGIRGEPAQSNGQAVAVRFRYPVRFTIR